MKVLCAISGIEFSCEHFPAELFSRETTHPIFHIKQKKLIGFISKWATGELTSTDSYLLFLALLNSSELIDWRVPVIRTSLTDSIVANNMESLVKVIGSINLVKNPTLVLPQFSVSKETKDLNNIHYWIEAWEDSLEEYRNAYKSTSDWKLIRNREATLERLIKTPERTIESYAGILADWAEIAGNFPRFEVTDYNNVKVSLSDYWKLIIRKCCKSESIFEVPRADIEELIEHCESNIPHGSIYSAKLMSLLRDGIKKQSGFLGFDLFNTKTEFTILDADTSVQDANKLALINSAPTEKPIEKDYPNKFAYIKAKLKYEMAQEYYKQLSLSQDLNSEEIRTPKGDLL